MLKIRFVKSGMSLIAKKYAVVLWMQSSYTALIMTRDIFLQQLHSALT